MDISDLYNGTPFDDRYEFKDLPPLNQRIPEDVWDLFRGVCACLSPASLCTSSAHQQRKIGVHDPARNLMHCLSYHESRCELAVLRLSYAQLLPFSLRILCPRTQPHVQSPSAS